MFRTGFVYLIRSLVLYTQQLVYVVQVMWTACSQHNHPKNKFEKLVHLVGFIIRIRGLEL